MDWESSQVEWWRFKAGITTDLSAKFGSKCSTPGAPGAPGVQNGMRQPLEGRDAVLAEALIYFQGRALKSGISWTLKSKIATTLESLDVKEVNPSNLDITNALLQADEESMTLAQERLEKCDSKAQQVCWKELIAILHLLKDNSHRALRIIKEAVAQSRALPFSERPKLLVSTLRTQQLTLLLHGESAAEVAKEAEAEASWAPKTPQEPFLNFLRFLLQQPPDDITGYLAFIDFLAMKLRSSLHEAKGVVDEVVSMSDLSHAMSDGVTTFFLGKLQLRTPEGLRCLKAATEMFRMVPCKEAEAAALQAMATAFLVQEQPNPTAAIDVAQKSQVRWWCRDTSHVKSQDLRSVDQIMSRLLDASMGLNC